MTGPRPHSHGLPSHHGGPLRRRSDRRGWSDSGPTRILASRCVLEMQLDVPNCIVREFRSLEHYRENLNTPLKIMRFCVSVDRVREVNEG